MVRRGPRRRVLHRSLWQPIHAQTSMRTYLCGVREDRSRRHERGRIWAEFAGDPTDATRLVYLHDDVLTLDIRAVHGFLRFSRILFPPELHDSGVFAHWCWDPN